ncbi:MAG: DUF86 domain-containing protein [Deltaproteobacteria bacterium]|nr:DUF86 domain-containing protein [Deltaproteobacteria bacterium]MBW2119035.1 DUF86 domain-containing protein [Deltaproteobacteria bacterium]MBW2344231.1 DUF86 domain-containing protein [Deltaproteobacteria bacterium]
MLDDIIRDNLQIILESIVLIEHRFSKINSAEDLVSSTDGVLILDAIAMRLQVVGELLKKINKTDKSILENYPEIEWDNIMRLRDIVSHHYEKVDHEIIFDICKNHIPKLKSTIHKIIEKENLQKPGDPV